MNEEILHALADDAFVVLNWARRQGLKRDQQKEQVMLAMRKTLTEAGMPVVATQTESAP